ncbi:unnamed protein product, partial [Mesorhabditis belari]|uniref:Uncharacterized protein n=1 Tax=Mesorhabditis belari TaxID=2138241 RepID=A0AAF3ESU2_9BILA
MIIGLVAAQGASNEALASRQCPRWCSGTWPNCLCTVKRSIGFCPIGCTGLPPSCRCDRCPIGCHGFAPNCQCP